MSFATKFNQGSRKVFNATGEGLPYVDLGSLPDKVFPVRAVFVNPKSKFGEFPCIISDEFIVSLPSHRLETVKSILEDQEAISDINDGKVGFQVYYYTDKKGISRASVNWVDV